MNPEDSVAIGDLESTAKGSAARKNGGKPRLELVPVRIWIHIWSGFHTLPIEIEALLLALRDWQEGKTSALPEWLEQWGDIEDVLAAVKVLEFGAVKYKAWNWAKGMPWSACVGSTLRHIEKLLFGQDIDEESNLPHWGHIYCNVIFLVWYAEHYIEGDDRPPIF